MKTQLTKMCSVMLFALLTVFCANAQIYQQQFAVDSASFNNRAMATGYYVNTTPSNAQLTYLGSSNATSTVQVSTGALKIGRTGSGSCYAIRNANFTATSLIYEFDFNITSASGTNSSAISFWLGNGFTNANTTPSNLFSTFNIAISSTTGPAWRINNAGTAYTGIRRVLWALNKTGATINYRAPNGTEVSLANNAHDIWVYDISNPSGATKEVNGVTVTGTTQALQNFGFRNGATGSNNNYVFDNMLLDPIPSVPTSSAATSIGSSSFTANWSTVAGVTGYRIDVATDAAFTSMVSGYNNLYVSGQATNSLNVTGLGGGTYYYRVRAASQYIVDEIAGGNSASQNLTLTCTTPTINTQPSTGTQTVCVNGSLTALSVSATGATSYQWYSNSTNSNTGGTLVTGATSSSYTPSNVSASSLYYYCSVSAGVGCTVVSDPTGLITVNALPVPTFTAAPSGTVATNTNQIYTTQVGQSNYSWTFSGTVGVDYTIVSGGTSSDNSTVVSWLTGGSKTVTVNYANSNSCTGASAASASVTASAAVFYNVAGSDVTVLTNWGTNTDGSGTNPVNFTDAGQTFNLFNSGATMSTSWDVQGAGTKVVIGNAATFAATQTFTTTLSAVVDVAAGSTLQLSSTTLPTFGTLASGSTVDYAGTAQTVVATSYSNLTISGSSTTLSGTVNVSGIFSPGTASAGTSTVVLNGTSSSQSIPAFAYNSLSVIGVDGKSTTGSISVSGTLTMSNSFTVSSGHTLTMGSAATMSSTASKVLTVNGTFELQQSSVTFNAGSGSVSIAAGGVLKMTGTLPNNALAFTNVNFTSGVGAAGSTLYLATLGCPRLPAATFNGNVTYDLQTSTGVVNILNTTPITITGNMNILGTGGVILTQASGGTARSLIVQGSLNMSGAARYDISANGSTGACALTVNGNVNITNTNDTLYTNNAASTGGTGTINILGNLSHSAGVLGRSTASVATGTIAFIGSSSQDIATVGITNNTNVTLNNSNGARLLTDLSVGAILTLTNGKLRTNDNSVIMTGSTSTIASASAAGYIATCDATGTPSTIGGLTIQAIGTGGRTATVSFPIGTNNSYNPATVTNSSASVAYTARVNTTPFAGTTTDSTVARTWNIQPASGTPSSIIGLQWNLSEQGANFNNSSAAIARYNTVTSSVDAYSDAGVASGSNPYTLNSGATAFTSHGDFGLIPSVIIPASEPTTQASNVSITPSNTSMNISWTAGNGSNSIVVVKRDTAVNAAPVDGTSYNANTVMGSGSQIGTLNYIVYNSTGNSVTVTGLTSGTNYFVSVYTFNGGNGTENYLTTSPATASTTTTIPTYYYVGGTGSLTNTFATANMWANSLGGTPLAAFAPTNNDVFVFDGSNIGGGVSDSVSIAWINSTTTLGKIILQNNARVRIDAGGTRTVTLGNSGFVANTIALDIPTGSKLYFSGSATNISMAANSSVNISGNLQLGNTSNNITLIPNAIGSIISVNNGAYVEINGSSSSPNTFGTSTIPFVTFKNGSTVKLIRANDIFGGVGNNAVSFEPTSLFIYANTSNSTSMTASGRTFGNVQIEGNWSPAGHNGFTMYNVSMPNSTGYTFTINDSSTLNFKGDINIAANNTLRFNTPATSTISVCNFNGTGLQTITNNGAWTVGSTLRQNFVVSNGVGLNVAGTVGISTSGLTGSSFTLNNGNTLGLNGGTLVVPNSGTLNINGSLTRTNGNITATSSTSTVVITGASNVPANTFKGDTAANLNLNRSGGITFNGNINIITNLTLTNGVVDMGNFSMNIFASKTLTRVNGWIKGNLRKNVATGSNVARSYEVGDASNYTPVNVIFSSVSTAGDLAIKSTGSISSQPNIATAPVSTSAYVNRYWSLTNANSLAFTNYKATFNYVNTDFVGGANASSVVAAKYSSGWSKSTAIAVGATADSVNAFTTLGDIIFANDCVTVTPTISISSTSTTFCTGSSATFTADITNGGSTPSYQWKRNNNNIGTNSSTLTLFATDVANGDVITCVLTSNNVCQTASTTTSNGLSLAVGGTVTPSLTIVTASDTVCSGNTTTFTALATDGGSSPVFNWKKNFVDVGSGSSISFLGGTLNTGDIISCVLTANNICQTTATANSNYVFLTVKTSPVVMQTQSQSGAIITSASICTLGSAGTTRFGNVTPFGTWSSSNPSVASVNYQGFVTGNTNGTATISYAIASNNGCVAVSNVLVTVAPATAPEPISGVDNVCAGSSITLSSNTPNGVWSCAQTSQATVNPSTGILLGKSAGFATVNYTTTNANGCTAFVSKTIRVNALPAVPTIAYAPGTVLTGPTSPFFGAPTGSFCVGRVFTVVGSSNVAGSGVWSATGAASITSGGVVTINSVGAGTVKYTYTSSFGCVNSRTISASGFTCAARGIATNDSPETVTDFILYPNPAKSIININVETLIGKGSIIVSDLYGKQIKTQMLSMGINTLDITKLSKGMYFVSLITNEGKTTKKLIVE
ncbi:MAG: T9SS type A sorting domain-containing protein [Chitinophagaceae bacterium]